MFSEFDRLAMTRALALAEKGAETTHPNPRVGCVIALGERIIGEGWHERAGEAHAEIVALRSAKEPVAGGTAYVTLEPCSHHGRTPPCVNALIEARFLRVVFAVQDPNPQVSGRGADALLRAGITVETGLMEAEATEINIGFMKRMKHGLPWVRIKLAMSLDGRTALANGASQWITGELARNDVQRWRARSSAVMTGVGTVLFDDPQLNVRTPGFKGRQPLRVVLDSYLRSAPGAKVFTHAAGQVIVFAALDEGTRLAGAADGFVAAASAADDLSNTVNDMAELVKAFENLPGSVTAKTDDSVTVDAPGAVIGDIPSAGTAGGTAASAGPTAVGGLATATKAAGMGGVVGAAPAASTPDDATWAGAALSGGVQLGRQPPSVRTSSQPNTLTATPRAGTGQVPGPTPSLPAHSDAAGGTEAAPPRGAAETSGQPAGASGQSAGASGQSAGTSGQSAGASGQSAGTSGQPAGTSGQPAGTNSQSTGSNRRSVGSGGAPAGTASATQVSSGPPSPEVFEARRAALLERGVRVEAVAAEDGYLDLFAVLQRLAQLEVNEVLVEAGPTLAGQLLTTFFADELLLYIAPKLLGPQGRPLVNLPELQSLQDAWGFTLLDAKRFGDDLRLRFRPK